jgi:polyhydroxybutyrate depolymerase
MRRSAAFECAVGHLPFIRWSAAVRILSAVLARFFRSMSLLALLVCFGVHAAEPATASLGVDTGGVLSFGGLNRTYLLHVPAGIDHPAGLVINLHGAGMTGASQASATHYNSAADAHAFAVVYPDGIDMSWADGRGASVPDRQGVDDVGFLVALADRLTHDYGIPPGRVFATGMSAGAFMATRLACDRADVVAAIAPVSGTLGAHTGCTPSRPVSVLETHGTGDSVVPFDGGAMVGRGGPSEIESAQAMANGWRNVDGCPGAPVEDVAGNVHRFTSSGCAEGTEVVLVQIDGGGHVWPGDASQASGGFFAAHGR